jgi:HAD superfamily hydrolase (TIGR01509 family)
MTALGWHKGVIFDLDGTLVDTRLDFTLLCQRLGWPVGTPILEHLATLTDPAEYAVATQIIEQFELEGAEQASWMPGAAELLRQLQQQKIPTAILTRNIKSATNLCMKKLQFSVDIVLTREDCAPKPDPEGLLKIANHWQRDCRELLFIGDYVFDLQTAARAGMPSCLYRTAENGHFAAQADFVIDHFIELQRHYIVSTD